MLSEVIGWLKVNSNHEFIFNDEELTKSIIVDIDNDENLARFIFWDDNSCMLESMNVNTGEYILNERKDLSCFEEFIEAYRKFERSLK